MVGQKFGQNALFYGRCLGKNGGLENPDESQLRRGCPFYFFWGHKMTKNPTKKGLKKVLKLWGGARRTKSVQSSGVFGTFLGQK